MKYNILLLLSLLLISCAEQPARRPVFKSSGSFMKESIERNKLLAKEEEAIIENIIKNDSLTKYIASANGYWYTYISKNATETLFPKKGDVIYFTQTVNDINGNLIYEESNQEYNVDQEVVTIGLRSGLKLLKNNEKVRFLFPSQLAFGYRGDQNKVGMNTPLEYIIEVEKIDRK